MGAILRAVWFLEIGGVNVDCFSLFIYLRSGMIVRNDGGVIDVLFLA